MQQLKYQERKRHFIQANHKKAGVTILISDKTELRLRKIISAKEGNYIMTEWSILQEGKIIFNMYAPNNRVLKCMGQELIELK